MAIIDGIGEDGRRNREEVEDWVDRLDDDRFHEASHALTEAYECEHCGWEGTEPWRYSCKRKGVLWHFTDCPDCGRELKEIE